VVLQIIKSLIKLMGLIAVVYILLMGNGFSGERAEAPGTMERDVCSTREKPFSERDEGRCGGTENPKAENSQVTHTGAQIPKNESTEVGYRPNNNNNTERSGDVHDFYFNICPSWCNDSIACCSTTPSFATTVRSNRYVYSPYG